MASSSQHADPETAGTAAAKGKDKGKEVNTDRRIMLVTGPTGDKEVQEEKVEYDFGKDEEIRSMPRKWMAVARFYSGKKFDTWSLFNDLCKIWGKKDNERIPAFREFGDNMFYVEFDSERLWKKAIWGGPWKYKEDAVIFVAYDGIRRLSDIAIDSIAIWVRFFDIPTVMMTVGFLRTLGSKLGKVLEVGEIFKGYRRVRVEYPLEQPLLPMVDMDVKGMGNMVFSVRYENTPHHCFTCGRMGHAKEECPDELDGAGVIFPKSLRCSPQKWDAGRTMSISSGEPKAKRGLNFSGAQKTKVMAAAGSPNAQARSRSADATSKRRARDEEDSYSGAGASAQQEKASEYQEVVEENLAKGVENMVVDGEIPNLNAIPPPNASKERVSGINSYAGSGGSSMPSESAKEEDNLSLLERLARAKEQRGVQARLITKADGFEGNKGSVKEGESPAKRSRLSTTTHDNLTGTRGESRQDQ
ncbi:unnamed protein product [Urochloa humidicola]